MACTRETYRKGGVGLAINPDGKSIYLSNRLDDTVTVFDAQTLKKVAELKVGKRPWNMATTRDGTKLFVANGK